MRLIKIRGHSLAHYRAKSFINREYGWWQRSTVVIAALEQKQLKRRILDLLAA